MTTWYLDSSAAMKLLTEEAETDALASAIHSQSPFLVSCCLLDTEMRRTAHRVSVSQADVTDLLEGVDLSEVPPALFRQAGLLPGAGLRSLDAIHLVAALSLDVDVICTYDKRLAEGARNVGLPVLAPS